MYNYFSGFIATPTKIRNFLECPRKYWYYHINPETKRLYPEKSYFTLGHHVHSALRDFFKISPVDRSKEKLLQLIDEQWKTKTGSVAGFGTPEIEAESKSRAITMLKLFLETEDWRVTPIYLPEKDGDFPGYKQIPIDNSLAFGGIIDRIDENPDGTLHIIDYKTGKGDEPDEWQLPIYAVLIGRSMHRIVGNISYIFLPHGKRHTEEINIQKNVDTIKRVMEVVNRIPKSKAKVDFVCSRGDRCFHCDYLQELGFDPITGKSLLITNLN